MIEKTVFLVKVLLFLLLQTQTTNGLFVSIGDYPNHTKYGINLPECGLRFVPHIITRQPKCFLNNPGNTSEVIFNRPGFIEVDKVKARVFNGRDAMLGDSSWTVRLHIHYKFSTRFLPICTGSLITFEWILTAAHCVDDHDIYQIEVKAGSHNWKNFVDITQMFMNPLWDKTNEYEDNNDIALIRLVRRYPSNLRDGIFNMLNTICLPNEALLNQNEEFGTFSGWGWIDIRGTLPEKLQIYETEIKNNSLCKLGFLCADDIDNEPGSCSGDSGGPLFQFSDEVIPRAIQVGVLKGGKGGCKRSNRTSEWTPPMRFIPWILETIANNTLPLK